MRLQNADNKWIAVFVSFKMRALSEYSNILDSFMLEIRVLRCVGTQIEHNSNGGVLKQSWAARVSIDVWRRHNTLALEDFN